MGFYDLSKPERNKVVETIHTNLWIHLGKNSKQIPVYFTDDDTYIRKTAYLSIGKLYRQHPDLQQTIIQQLHHLLFSENEKVRQTTINAAGEIGIHNFAPVDYFFDTGLFDKHHTVRNAVIGSIKKMGAKNPIPVLQWAKKYLHHSDKEVRREICHGIELRGRTHPQDILPLLKELQFDTTARVKNTLVHVIGQIAYKKGCLETVIEDLKTWDNKMLVLKAIDEIIDVHNRYKDFAVRTQAEAIAYIYQHYRK
jgi:hypothetical protein